uniref:N-acetyl-gamma-glutamyl-phosphate reductase n=1 Tax=Anthurium amnicola TaxID=1678845 RepID=A0A1D1XYJ7_9ARAE
MQRQSRYLERSGTMAREKRGLDATGVEDKQLEPKRQKVPALASVIVEALKVDSLQKLCSSLEPVLRRVVSEEVERALAKLGPPRLNGRSSPKRIEGPDGRNLQLHFRSRLSLPIFTGGKVEGEQGAAIHVVLLDANTDLAVTTGPETYAKLDVVVLEGDFSGEDDDDWTEEDFESHIVKEREGKGPILTGDLQVSLKEGVGTLGDLTFTDNSSWIRSRKFRLGLKIASGFCEGIRIREARTEAFPVKDHRGELYKKHYPPALQDDVWRLEKIGKDGSFHKRLNKAGIRTVEDFLRLVVRDSQRLRSILGSGMSNKMWESLVEHAKTCVLSGKLYVYYSDDSRTVGAVFNNIYEFCGLITSGQYYSAECLSDSQKFFADTLVKRAYDNWMDVIEYDGKALSNSRKGKRTSPQVALASPTNYPTSFDHHISLPCLPVPASEDQIPVDRGSGVGGAVSAAYNESHISRYSTHPHEITASSHVQVDGSSFTPQNQLMGSHHTQIPRNDSISLALGPRQQTSLGFQQGTSVQASNINPFDDWPRHRDNQGFEDAFSEEEIRMRSHEMLENEDMQNLLRVFSMGGASANLTEDGYSFPHYMPSPLPNFNFDEDRSRSSGRAVVGWLKIKAAMRWGIFIRKKAAERRAQLVELQD